MHSFRANVENPWNLFAADEILPKPSSLNKFSNVSFTHSTQNFERFLSNKVPVSFSGRQNVICCNICNVLVTRNRYKEHHDDRHNLCNNKANMIPFEDELLLHNDKIYETTKKVKRCKKKRCTIQEKLECSSELIINKKKTKKIKVKSASKRLHPKSIFDEIEYVTKKKKLTCEFIEKLVDKKHFAVREDDFLSSPKQLDDNFYQDKLIVNKSYNPLSINDGLCYSNDSVHRTSSDSSTPPSLSLGTLQTLSSPSSLNILNDLSTAITEHYLLPSNDLTAERSGISCKYQIDSLPWENLPPTSSTNKIYNINTSTNSNHHHHHLYTKDKESFNEVALIEEDGEIERAVQSITGFYECCLPDEFEINNQVSFDMTNDGSKSISIKAEHVSIEENNIEMKLDMFTADDTTVIDCFLDEAINGHPMDKDHLSDNCTTGRGSKSHINAEISQNTVDLFLDDCNNLCEYQIDSNLLNIFNSDYEEKFETLINNTMNEFGVQSPQSVSIDNAGSRVDRKKGGAKIIQTRSFDPLKHCGVVGANGQFCYRSLLCKLHTMPQKRQVERSENITSLIKGIRDCNKIKKLSKKSTQTSIDSRSSCSKMSCDSFLYNCSSNKSVEEMPPVLDRNLSSSHDTDTSGFFHCASQAHNEVRGSTMPNNNVHEPQPLVVQKYEKEVIVSGSRPLMTTKSLVWKHRPKSQCDPQLVNRFLSNQNGCLQKSTPMKQAEFAFHDILTGDVFHPQAAVGASGKALLAASNTDFAFDQFGGSGYGNTAGYFDVKYSCNGNIEARDCQLSTVSIGKFQQHDSCAPSNIYNEPVAAISSANSLSLYSNANVIPTFTRDGVHSNSTLLSTADVALLSNNVNSVAANKNLLNNNISLPKSQITSPGGFANCTNQLVGVNGQHSNSIDITLADSSINSAIVSFSDSGCGTHSLINTSNQSNNTSLWNSMLSDPSFCSSNKFISITDDRSGATQMLYPVRNGGPIMMVMNKHNHKLVNDHAVDLNNESFSFPVNGQSIPINSLLALKQQQQQQNAQQISPNQQQQQQQQRNVGGIHQQQQQPTTTTVPTQQIVSISPLELQRLTDGLCTNSATNQQMITTDCGNPSKNGGDKKNQSILYQLNQATPSTGQFISSTLSSKIDNNNSNNNLPKPLTVQSSTPNGITHRFVILPDGTISAFSQQSTNNMKQPNITQQQQQPQPQLIGRTTLQHPLFGQLSNCGQNQGCFFNGDKLIIAPNQVTSNAVSQQIIMPQIINQADLNNQPTSRFTLVHQQQKLGGAATSNGAAATTPKNNYNRLSHNNVSTQVPIDSSNQKLSFHIQTPTQYQNHNPNTFFLTTAPSGNSNMPLKQQIILQSNDQIGSDFSLMDSNKFVDGTYNNAQRKPIHHFENVQCNTDVRTINSSNQDFEFLNHVINPQSIIIQQPPVNRLQNQSQLSQLSNTNVVQNNFLSQTSQDINSGIDGAHSNVSNTNQHIVINNCSNEQFAQSQLTLSQRQLSTPFSNASNCSSVVVNQNQSNFKTVPPPLVISQQLLNQSAAVSNQFGNKSFIDIPYQQQPQQKNSHINQVSLDENQFSNEFVIMQSMIA